MKSTTLIIIAILLAIGPIDLSLDLQRLDPTLQPGIQIEILELLGV